MNLPSWLLINYSAHLSSITLFNHDSLFIGLDTLLIILWKQTIFQHKARQFGNSARHSWGTKLKTLGHSCDTVGEQLGQKVIRAQLGHSWGKTGWGTVEAQSGLNLRTKWRKFNMGHSLDTVGAHSGHTFSLDTVGAQHFLSIAYIIFNSLP